MKIPHILLIEDDAVLRSEIRDYLMRQQNTVRDCATLAEARQALDERRPDVVISDIHLPDGNGAFFCRDNAGRHPTTRWLLMSGDPAIAHQSRQLRRDPDGPPFSVLDKPASLRALVDFIRLAMMQRNLAATVDIAASRS